MPDARNQESSDLDRLYALIAAQRWDAVEAAARSSVANHPRYYYPLWALSLALLRLQRLEEARETAEAACGMAPDVFWNSLQLSDVARAQGDKRRALDAARRSVELEPTTARTYRCLAYAYGVQPFEGDAGLILDSEGALAAIAQAIELEPGIADDHRFRGGILGQLGRRSEAAAAYRTSLALDPTRHEAVNNLALLHLPRRPILAASLFRESARLDPSCPHPRHNLTSAVHATTFRFTWIMLLAGMASVLVQRWLPPILPAAILAAAALVGIVGGVALWRTLPPGTRLDTCHYRWPSGLLFMVVLLVVLGADLGAVVAGPRTRVMSVTLLITLAALFLALPRSRWSKAIGKRLGTWWVPTPRVR